MIISTNGYRMVLRRDADFWQDELTITDASVPVPLLAAELTIHPSGELTPVVWNEANGKLSMPSDGVIRFTILLEEIAGYGWSTGTYCLAVTYTNGMRDRSFLTGKVEIEDAC